MKVLYTYAAFGHKCKRLHKTIVCSTFTSWAGSPALSTFLMLSYLSHVHQNNSLLGISGPPVLQVFHILPADHVVRRMAAANPLLIAVPLTIIKSDLRVKEFCFNSGFKMLPSNWTPSKVEGTCRMACYSWWIRKQKARPELGNSLQPKCPPFLSYDHHLGPRSKRFYNSQTTLPAEDQVFIT